MTFLLHKLSNVFELFRSFVIILMLKRKHITIQKCFFVLLLYKLNNFTLLYLFLPFIFYRYYCFIFSLFLQF